MYNPLYFGYLFFSIALGFLLGASNTPVIGSFITAFFALIAAIAGTKFFSNKDDKKSTINFLGIAMILVSVGLIGGEISGEAYRNGWGISKNNEFPWVNETAPESTYEAVDWIMLREKLLTLGYSDKEIQNLYKIRLKEKKILEKKKTEEKEIDPYSQTKIYNAEKPFSELLITKIENNKNGSRGPASIP